MAVQRKSARKTQKKAAAKKPTRAPRSARKSKPAPKSTVRASKGKTAPSRKAASRKTPTAEAIARKIVRLTAGEPADFRLEELYSDECTSREPTDSKPVVGLKGLQEKLDWWRSIQESQTWKAKNVFVKGNTICIEWEAEVKLKDGPTIQLEETAIHEVRGGKIVAERYYYDPSTLAPEAQETEEQASRVPAEIPPNIPPTGSPPLDPMDL
jgi:ketosteroid isomerase-like protein